MFTKSEIIQLHLLHHPVKAEQLECIDRLLGYAAISAYEKSCWGAGLMVHNS